MSSIQCQEPESIVRAAGLRELTPVGPWLTCQSAADHQQAGCDPNVVVSPSGSLGDFLDDEFRAPAFEFRTLGAFGAIGLILAAVGIFSVMAYTVSLQTHAIGVRMSLGAAPREILR